MRAADGAHRSTRGSAARGKPEGASWLGPQFPARQFGSIQSPGQEKGVGKRQQMNEMGFVDLSHPAGQLSGNTSDNPGAGINPGAASCSGTRLQVRWEVHRCHHRAAATAWLRTWGFITKQVKNSSGLYSTWKTFLSPWFLYAPLPYRWELQRALHAQPRLRRGGAGEDDRSHHARIATCDWDIGS